MSASRILGTGHYVPPKVVTNFDVISTAIRFLPLLLSIGICKGMGSTLYAFNKL